MKRTKTKIVKYFWKILIRSCLLQLNKCDGMDERASCIFKSFEMQLIMMNKQISLITNESEP